MGLVSHSKYKYQKTSMITKILFLIDDEEETKEEGGEEEGGEKEGEDN